MRPEILFFALELPAFLREDTLEKNKRNKKMSGAPLLRKIKKS
jgi:hypothetical protein